MSLGSSLPSKYSAILMGQNWEGCSYIFFKILNNKELRNRKFSKLSRDFSVFITHYFTQSLHVGILLTNLKAHASSSFKTKQDNPPPPKKMLSVVKNLDP